MLQVFVDLDDVLADCEGFYRSQFGRDNCRDDQSKENVDRFWHDVRAHGSFFRSLPILPDARQLMLALVGLHSNITILTAIPSESVLQDAAAQKWSWLAEHFPHTPVICCRGKDKRLHGRAGDILIDDWERNRRGWESIGGTFIRYTGYSSTIDLIRTAIRSAKCLADSRSPVLDGAESPMCARHPGEVWKRCRDGMKCEGPGVPWRLEGRTLIEEMLKAK